MHDLPEQEYPYAFDQLFAQLTAQDVEQFSAVYHQWMRTQQTRQVRRRVEQLRQWLVENDAQMRHFQPSPLALATLARLQASGVQDTALLDAMLERGENWLDQTMQRLDYCEQLDDFLSEDYTQWCQRALEGAYDWIDSLREAATHTPSDALQQVETAQPDSPGVEATEEMMLQRLTSSDELSWQEETLKQAAIRPLVEEEHLLSPEETRADEAAPPAKQAEDEVAVEENSAIPAGDARGPEVQQPQDETPSVSEPVYSETSAAQALTETSHEDVGTESYPSPEALPPVENPGAGVEIALGEVPEFVEFAPAESQPAVEVHGMVNEEEASFFEFSYWEEQEIPGDKALAVEYVASDDLSPFEEPEQPVTSIAPDVERYEFINTGQEEGGAPVAKDQGKPGPAEIEAVWQVDTGEQKIVEAPEAQPTNEVPPVETREEEEAQLLMAKQDTSIQPAAPTPQPAEPQPTHSSRAKKPGFFSRLFGLR